MAEGEDDMVGADLSANEILQNAQINFGNVAIVFPRLAQLPIWQMATDQLRNGLKKLEAEEAAREGKNS